MLELIGQKMGMSHLFGEDGVVSPLTFVKLYDNKGATVLTEVFKIENGCTPGDLSLPKDLAKGNYSLVAYTLAHNSPEDISLTLLQISPEYSDYWIAEVKLKDSISTPGQKNELFVILHDISGDILKNTPLIIFREIFTDGLQ